MPESRRPRSAERSPPLAEAKLAAPRLRPELIRRPRVEQALDAGEGAALTLVAAPAGYGKTTAVRAWCESRNAPVAWVTLDVGDNDPVRLWTYVATAVDRVREGLGLGALHRLRSSGASVDDAVDDVVEGIRAFGDELILVLDELESVTDPDCLASIDHAAEHLPANARLVLIARSDPSLRTARRRVGGRLVELRADDLAFTTDETAELLARRGDVHLDPPELELLQRRTEGWPAALELATIWLRGVDDPAEVVREFTGDHRFVADFLSQEVIGALPDDVRGFMLRVSVLGRFTAPLCDVVLGRTDSASLLGELERSHLFLNRLEKGGWYRVHPLFAEFAAFALGAEDPEAAVELHRGAATWLATDGHPVEAIDHAAAAGDLDLVARLVVAYHLALIRTGHARTVLRWVEELPEAHLLEYPELAVAGATAALVIGGRTVERRRLLRLADRARPDRRGPYVDAAAAMVRAAAMDGTADEAVDAGIRAVELAETDADDVLIAALAALARVRYFVGDLDGAWETALRAIEHPDSGRRAPGHSYARATLAHVAADRGQLAAARVHAEKAKALVSAVGSNRSWLGAGASIALGVVLAAEGRLVDAERELVAAEHFYRDELASPHQVWLLLLLARVRMRRGRLAAAVATLREAQDAFRELEDGAALARLAAEVEAEIGDARDQANGGRLVERPSEAELAVLRLLTTDLSMREISGKLFLSPNTVRTHTRSIYRKLSVGSRADAVARAETLGLLDGGESSG
jgi:LuxR family maltose regulon positive regulatory protein